MACDSWDSKEYHTANTGLQRDWTEESDNWTIYVCALNSDPSSWTWRLLALRYILSGMGYMLGKSETFGVLCPCIGPSTSVVILMAIGDCNFFIWYWLLGNFLCDLWRMAPEVSWDAELKCSEDKRWVRDMIMQNMIPCTWTKLQWITTICLVNVAYDHWTVLDVQIRLC